MVYAVCYSCVVCLVTGLGIGAVVILILFAQGLFIGTKLGMMARIITTSAIYQKVGLFIPSHLYILLHFHEIFLGR